MPEDATHTASGLSLEELEVEICCIAGHINAAGYRWLALIAELDRRRGWAESSAQSCAHWLSWKCGVALGAAREKVRVARALEGLPRTAAAMASGRLSYSKAREITRIASVENEDYLLQIAEHGTAQHVEKLVRAYRRSEEAEELSREARQRESRSLGYHYDDDGSLVLRGRLPAEIGALLVQAIDAAVASLAAGADVPAGTLEPLDMRRADALGSIVESFVRHGAEEAPGSDRFRVVVHVDAETLQERVAGRCEIEDGPSIAAETARRLACDASVIALAEGASGEPLDVGRKTRTISTRLRRLLRTRDGGCRFPGCANQRYVDAHHIRHWANGGETKPSNLISLCRFHHRAVHEGGVRIRVLDDGAMCFVKADGSPIDRTAPGCMQPVGSWRELCSSHAKERIEIDAETAVSRWAGESMDYDLASDVLSQLTRRAS